LDERKIEFEMSEQQLSKPVGRKVQGTESARLREERGRSRDSKPARGKSAGSSRDATPRKRAAEKVDLSAPTDVKKSRAVKQELLSGAKSGDSDKPARKGASRSGRGGSRKPKG